METDILIVGAGLSGLSLARILVEQGRNVQIIEARDRVGGRVLSHQHGASRYDLGPAWFWQGQPRIAALIRKYDLKIFEQYASGTLIFQDGSGTVRRDLTMAPMAGSLRLDGGLSTLTQRLADELGPDRIHPGHRIKALSRETDKVIASIVARQSEIRVTASHVVLAMPPRVASAQIDFSGDLPSAAKDAMTAVPTWMAGHAKLIALYHTPFWRNHGLSGDAISHIGPLAEIHDASPADASAGALFGFVGTPADRRVDEEELKQAAIQQLTLLFGSEAAVPSAVLMQDWAHDPWTATRDDHQPPASHPAYGRPTALNNLWDNRLHFASSEMATTFGGYLEGALEAAEQTATSLIAG